MRCPNCYNENEPGRTTCKYCGTTLPEVDDTVQEVIEQEEVQQTNSDETEQDYNSVQVSNYETYETETITKEEPKKKIKKEKNKKSKKVIVLVLVILVLLSTIAGGIYFYISSTTPEKIYRKAINESINAIFNNPNYDAKSGQLNARVEVETSQDGELSALNGFVANASIGVDLKDEQALLKLKVDHGEDAYLDATFLGDLKRERIYAGDANLFSKLISIDIPEEYIAQINYMIDFEALVKKDTANSRSQMSQVLTKKLNDNLKVENITRVSTKIQYNGKQKSVKDNMLVLTEGEFKTIATNILTELNSDETFLTALGDSKEDIVEIFEKALGEIKYLNNDDEVETPNKVVLHLYTSGIKYDYAGFRIEAISNNSESQIVAQVIKTGENTYTTDYIRSEGEEINQTTTTITINPLEDGTTDLVYSFKYGEIPVTLKINYNYSVNQGIESIDLDSSVKYTELKNEDFNEMMSNLEDSPIYEIVYLVMKYIEENGIEFEFNGGVNSETSLPNNIKLEQNQSFLITRNDNIAVFEVPTAFEVEYNGNMYKSYSKNNRIGDKSQVYLNLISGNAKELINEYIKEYDYLTEKTYKTVVDEKGVETQVEEESKYKDVSISDVREEIVNGVTYYRLDVKYTSGSIKNNIVYYGTQLSDDYSYIVRVEDGSGIISSSEMEKILSITKY